MSARSPQALAGKYLNREWQRLTAIERFVLERVFQRHPVSRNINREFEDARTRGERLADLLTAFGGSWPFILLFLGVVAAWIALNTAVLARGAAFDPYPYILLNLALSLLAALQAPVILMSQNRGAARDRLDAANDYAVNLKAEIEIQRLHEKLDILRAEEWVALVQMQRDQIRLLETLLTRTEAGPGAPGDASGS